MRTSFNDLDLETYYPKNNPDFELYHRLTDMANEARATGDIERFHQLDVETHAFLLRLDRGTLGPPEFAYGDIALSFWDANSLEALQQRAVETNNPWLRARYNHQLWALGGDSTEGELTVDAYTDAVAVYVRLTEREPEHFAMLIDCVQALSVASRALGYRCNDVQLLITDIVTSFRSANSACRAIQLELIELVVADDQFPTHWLERLDALMPDLFRRSYESGMSTVAQQAYKLGQTLRTRVGGSTGEWQAEATRAAGRQS